METLRTTIDVPPPFSLKATVLSHGWHECAPMSWSEGGRCFQVIDRIAGRLCRISVTEDTGRRRSKVRLNVMIEGDALEEGDVVCVQDRLRVVLGLDHDMAEFYEVCRDHPTLHVLPLLGAGRTLRSFCMVENIVKALCGTNVTWTQAVKMVNRLCQLGPCLTNYRCYNAWPTPREILRAGSKYLTEVCRVGYRAETIIGFCQSVCDGEFDAVEVDALARSKDVKSAEILARLRTIRGIGPSSAHYLLSFLGRHDHLSIDTATVAHVARAHTNDRKPTSKRIERIYAKYGRWKNRVWWYEQWLEWGTAKQLVQEAGGTQRSRDTFQAKSGRGIS